MTLFNVFVSTYGTSPVVLKVHDCSRNLAGEVKRMLSILQKYSSQRWRGWIQKIIYGASNVQGVGEVVEGVFTQGHTIQRADHVLYIFFDGIAKIPQIKVSDIYNTSSLFFYH